MELIYLDKIIMTQEQQRTEAIKMLSNRRVTDKFSLHHTIKILNHKKYFYSYLEWYSRNEWLERVIEEINTDEGLNKLLKLNSYAKLQ